MGFLTLPALFLILGRKSSFSMVDEVPELNKHITTTTYEELKHRDANFKRIDCSQSQRGIE